MITRHTFCAICTDDDTECRQRPIGANDAPVWICKSCDEDPPLGYDFNGGRASGFGVSIGNGRTPSRQGSK